MTKKRNKKYKPNRSGNKLEGSTVLKAFLCDHDSFVSIDNLIHKIKNLCKLDYKQGIGYVMLNELGEEVSIIQKLNEWIEEWQSVAEMAQVQNYRDNAIRSIVKKLNFNLDISDELIAEVEKEINVQRAIYRKLSQQEAGKKIIETAIRPRIVKEQIKNYLTA